MARLKGVTLESSKTKKKLLLISGLSDLSTSPLYS